MGKEPSVWDEHAFWRKLILPQEDRRPRNVGYVTQAYTCNYADEPFRG